MDVVKRPRRIPRSKWAQVRLFAMDVDGILTDGTIAVCSDGTETKGFSVLDGMGLGQVRDAGIILAWISGRPSGATAVRAKELRIAHLIQGRRDKLVALRELADSLGVPLSQCVYMGDDHIDAAAIEAAGIGVTVPEAMPPALRSADLVTRRAGGHGAVREVCDLILAARPKMAAERNPRGRPVTV